VGFKTYAAATGRELRLGLRGWLALLRDAGLVGKGPAAWGRQLTARDARAAWAQARRCVVGASSAASLAVGAAAAATPSSGLGLGGVFEALARVAEVLARDLPMATDLGHYQARDLVE